MSVGLVGYFPGVLGICDFGFVYCLFGLEIDNLLNVV